MLYLEIKFWEEAMKTLEFQQEIGGTASCMKIIMKATKGCGELSSNNTYSSDRFFSGLKTAEESSAEGVDYCGLLKTSRKVFFSSYVRKFNERVSGRVS